MAEVYLSLGSNVGDRKKNLRDAEKFIQAHIGQIAKESSDYLTPPWGKTDQDSFYNNVLLVNSYLNPMQIMRRIDKIELLLGKSKIEKWGPRKIDIDMLFYDQKIIKNENLEIPHPHLHERNFVLVPLKEISGDFVHPVLLKTIEEIYLSTPDQSQIQKLD